MAESSLSCVALANLDFEAELAGGPGYQTPSRLAEFCGRWRYLLRLLPQARSAECLDPQAPEASQRQASRGAGRLMLWGVTPRALRLAAALGLGKAFPPIEVVREVNDKRFSHLLESELGIALPFSRQVDSLESLEQAVAICPHDWVLKHPMGFSARERMVGKCGTVTPSALGWAGRVLGRGWTLIFEPWVYQRRDFSTHFYVTPEGRVEFLGWCEMVGDPGGVYRGNRVLPEARLEAEVLERAGEVARKVAGLGYWGWLGLDGFEGELEGARVSRPLVEINARCSFGRLTLALREWVPAGWSYLWWHPQRPQPSRPPLCAQAGAGLYSLPRVADPDGASGTVVAIAPDSSELQRLEESLRELKPLGVAAPGL